MFELKIHFLKPIPVVIFCVPVGQFERNAFSGQRIQLDVSKIWYAVLLHLPIFCVRTFEFTLKLFARTRKKENPSRISDKERNRSMI